MTIRYSDTVACLPNTFWYRGNWAADYELHEGRMYTHIRIAEGQFSHKMLRSICLDLQDALKQSGRMAFYAILHPDSPAIRLVMALGYEHVGYEADVSGEIHLTYKVRCNGRQ